MSQKPIFAILVKLALACFVIYLTYKDDQPILYNFGWAFIILYNIFRPFQINNKKEN